MTIHMGEVIEREILVGKLIKLGYERVDQVERCGHFSVRGDIVDIFAINESHPFRVEFLMMKWTESVFLMKIHSVLLI